MTALYVALAVIGGLLALWIFQLWIKSLRLVRWAKQKELSPEEAEQISKEFSALERAVRDGRRLGHDMSEYDGLFPPKGGRKS